MWSFYPPPRRKSSGSSLPSHPPLSPTNTNHFSSAIVESPELSPQEPFFQPRDLAPTTPRRLDVLSEHPPTVEASGGSSAPLIPRDFAAKPKYPLGNIDEVDQGKTTSESFVMLPQEGSSASSIPPAMPRQPQPAQSELKELLIPPPSVHDATVSTLITPIVPPDAPPTQPPSPAATSDRPPILRSRTAPGTPGQPPRLLPSPLPGSADGPESAEGKPIFEIFDADLSVPATDMVKSLKGHLEDVLRVQEEIGRMHLGLEHLSIATAGKWDEMDSPGLSTPEHGTSSGRGTTKGTPSTGLKSSKREKSPGSKEVKKDEAEEALAKREKGVDEIMEKLGNLSEALRTYHMLGTPRLAFPQPNNPSPSSPRHAIDSLRQTPQQASKKPSTAGVSPPPRQVAALRGQHMPPSPLSAQKAVGRSSDFSKSMTTLSETSGEPTTATSSDGTDPAKGDKRNSNLSPLSLRDERRGSASLWGPGLGDMPPQGPSDDTRWERRGSGIDPRDVAAAWGRERHREYTESPVEMVDRSRPW